MALVSAAWCWPFIVAAGKRNELLFLFSCGVCYGVSARNGALLRGTLSAEVARGVDRFVSSPRHLFMIPAKPTIVELDMDKLEEILRRLEAKELDADDYEMIKTVIGSYVYLVNVVGDKETTIRRLRQMLFGAKTEKTSAVIGDLKGSESAAESPEDEGARELPATDTTEAEASAGAGAETAAEAHAENDSPVSGEAPQAPPGHGRNGADAYTSAEKVEVRHESLQAGDPCPQCEEGTLYDSRPGVVVRLVGQPPVGALVYYLQKLRCNLCGALFTAELPDGVDAEKKYDATVGSMIALLKYGNGMPFHRQEMLQENLGIPLTGERARQAALAEETPAGTVEDAANDPTGPATANGAAEPGPDRTGMFTSGIVATAQGHKIALFLSGRRHAGENLEDVLAQRAAELPSPIQMCDALSRNLPGKLKTIVANCLAHGRRQFVDVVDRFPEECQHVLQAFSVVYHNDAIARERNLSPEERLLFHQAESGPTMEELHVWLGRQLDERRVEPNSALGKAMLYLLRHWAKLTLFLRVPGAPLDNNICERALKKAIRHRRNSLFYKTPHGAHVGDVFMSLIHTCELCGANPFDYLTELDRHPGEARENPQNWMPWNYRETREGKQHAQTPSEESHHNERCFAEAAQGPGKTHQGRAD